jgi:hypothetical protein
VVRHCLSAGLALLLAACAAPPPTQPGPPAGTAAAAVPAASAASPPASAAEPSTADAHAGAEKKFAQAVTAPLADLNLVREAIPEVLAAARKAPYAVPADLSCPALAHDVEALDAVLGADLDTPADGTGPSLVERGTTAAGDALIGAVRSTTEGVIPFRGWVRKLTGAERYAREVAASVAAGTIRRAFLKGIGQAQGCSAPAAPRPHA